MPGWRRGVHPSASLPLYAIRGSCRSLVTPVPQGSLFGSAPASGWNLNRLDSFLSQLVGPDMPGITQSMLYFGSWRSMFAFHKEVRGPPVLFALSLCMFVHSV